MKSINQPLSIEKKHPLSALMWSGPVLLSALVFSPNSHAYDCSNLDIWQSSDTYNGGDNVQLQSKAYQANWWNQNTNPVDNSGQWQEWSLLGNCDVAGNQPPSVAIESPSSDASFSPGNVITFEANATDSDGQITSLEWQLNGTTLAIQTEAPYQYPWSTEIGSYQVKAIATDDQGATSQASANFLVQDVTNQPPVASLSASTQTVNLGDSVELNVQASDADGTITNVVIEVDGQVLTTLTNSPYIYNWTPTTAGSFSTLARAQDDAGASAVSNSLLINVQSDTVGGRCAESQSYVAGTDYPQGALVNHLNQLYQCDVAGWCSSDAAWAYEPGVGQHWQDAWTDQGICSAAPQVSILSPIDGDTVILGSSVVIEASASDLDGVVDVVEAKVNGMSLGELAQPPFQWSWQSDVVGSALIEVIATDNELQATTSKVNLNVTDQPLIVELTSPSSGQTVPLGNSVTIAATSSALVGQVSKVEFLVNGALVASDANEPYAYQWQPQAIGDYQVMARAYDSEGNQVDSSSVSLAVRSIVQSKHKLIGYWHNFVNGSGCPIELNQMSKDWDIIDIAFADNDRNSNGTVHFNLYNGDIHSSCAPIDPIQFKQDIRDLQAQGKVFVLSLGGAEGTITLNTDSDEAAFVASLTAIIQEWGFDGLDIDLESGSNLLHGSEIQARLPRALRKIEANIGGDMYLTMAPEHPYVQGGMIAYSGIWGAYIPVIDQLRDTLDLLHVQLYNNGGLANPYMTGAAPEGSVDMMVASVKMLIEGFELADGSQFAPLRDDQVAIGLPSGPSSANSGQAPIANIEDALDCVTSLQRCSTVVPTAPSPNFGGVMTWSINWDLHDGFNFSVPVKAKLNQLQNR